MTYVQAALLGIVQGLSEFLPISSSGHLILARAFFGWDAGQFGLAFDVACHVGTLFAILLYFHDDLRRMALALPRIGTQTDDQAVRLNRLIALGTLPIVPVGLSLRSLEDTLRTPSVAALTLGVGGVLLLVADRVGRRERPAQTLTLLEGLALGCAQSVALVPGVSRSGATMTLGLFLGLRRDEAARFSFLLGVPAIAAAAAHEGVEIVRDPMTADTALLFAIGIAVSALVGYLTIKYFMRFLALHSLAPFAYYRLALAASLVVWLLVR